MNIQTQDHIQRSAAGLSYEKFSRNVRKLAQSQLPKHRDARKAEVQEHLRRMRQPLGDDWFERATPSSLHKPTTLDSMSIQYANDEYIGTRLMPVAQVSKMSDYVPKFDKASRFTADDDEVAEEAGTVDETYEEKDYLLYSARPYARRTFVDQLSIDNQDAAFNELLDANELVADRVLLREEYRIATVLQASASYDPNNTDTLSGSDRWDYSTGGNPLKNIQEAIAACFTSRGRTKKIGFMGLETWHVLRRHPAIRELFKYNESGMASRAQIAAYFELDEVLVGSARINTAKKGQTPVYARIWGKHFGVLQVTERATPRTATFGKTFRFGQMVNDQWFDQGRGFKGGFWARAGVVEDHKVVANDMGFLLRTVIS